jgi:hypothetical protein
LEQSERYARFNAQIEKKAAAGGELVAAFVLHRDPSPKEVTPRMLGGCGLIENERGHTKTDGVDHP